MNKGKEMLKTIAGYYQETKTAPILSLKKYAPLMKIKHALFEW